MCRLYAFRATEPTKVECTLVHAQNALMAQSRRDQKGYSHAHGWGVAAYENHLPHLERQAWAAYHGEHFQRAASRIYATAVVAHVRRATVGEPKLENTHPFVHQRWTFAHNGTLPAFDAVRPRLLEGMSREHRGAIAGATDSEHLFRYLLTAIDRSPDRPLIETLGEVVAEVVGFCRRAAPDKKIGLNVILTDGRRLAGTRFGRTLHHVRRTGVLDCEICGFPHVHHHRDTDYLATVIASEPISQEDWRAFPDRSIFQMNDRCDLDIKPLAAALA